MKKTTNTQENEMNLHWLLGGNPKAIEDQEARGQQELVASSQLPKKCNSPHSINATEQYHKMGIKTFTASKGDDIFIGTKLPDGWKKKATDHSMWNNLIDDKGRTRGTIFYKAAFYDRCSFINFTTRFNISTEYFEEKDEKGFPFRQYVAKDGNDVIWSGGKCTFENEDKVYAAAKEYLTQKYPDWQNINAYWD